MVRLGTRGSALALAQSQSIADAITARTGEPVELVTIVTTGDTSVEPLESLGGTGVFVGAVREALLDGRCDVIVHSLKDLPTTPHPELTIVAIPKRADARDALCARDDLTMDALPPGSTVGTGSPRRAAQLRRRRPDLDVVPIRGNVDTRLGKVTSGEVDAVILALAGLTRLGLEARATEVLGIDGWPTAPGQGALAIEVRASATGAVRSAAAALDHRPTRVAVEAERLVLARLEAGCSAPVAAHAFMDEGLLFLAASVYSTTTGERVSSAQALYVSDSKNPGDELSERVVTELFALGAAELAGLGARE
jgi:hydroxymethylbilane synthase